MLERGIGSAVVVDDKVVVGIFTVTDALRALVAVYSG
jgi:CBS domain-containing protein